MFVKEKGKKKVFFPWPLPGSPKSNGIKEGCGEGECVYAGIFWRCVTGLCHGGQSLTFALTPFRYKQG